MSTHWALLGLTVASCVVVGREASDMAPVVVASAVLVSPARDSHFALTSAQEGVTFDLIGDGRLVKVAWTEPASDVAFLAVDRNNDGAITNGTELFGNRTHPKALGGFSALHTLALESNGGQERYSVSSEDPLFSRLLLWVDANHNGISERAELRPAHELYSDFGLGYQQTRRLDQHGNSFAFRGWVHIRTHPGRNEAEGPEENRERTRVAWEVYLRTLP
jgi:hypothetical protein